MPIPPPQVSVCDHSGEGMLVLRKKLQPIYLDTLRWLIEALAMHLSNHPCRGWGGVIAVKTFISASGNE
jgi:hypothetical protein